MRQTRTVIRSSVTEIKREEKSSNLKRRKICDRLTSSRIILPNQSPGSGREKKGRPTQSLFHTGLPQCSSSLKGPALKSLGDMEETRIVQQENPEGKNSVIKGESETKTKYVEVSLCIDLSSETVTPGKYDQRVIVTPLLLLLLCCGCL
jgi:hypothetical protein